MLIFYENGKYKYKQKANEIEVFVEKKNALLISEVIFNPTDKLKNDTFRVYIIPPLNYLL